MRKEANVTESPIDLIRKGIEKGSWEDVCSGFKSMTGSSVKPPVNTNSPALTKLAEIHANLNAFFGVVGKVNDKPKAKATIITLKNKQEEVATIPINEARTKPEDPYAKFKMEPKEVQQVNEKGQKACRVLPFEPPGENTFVDDKTLAAEDIPLSESLSAKKIPEARRPEISFVSVTCCKCLKESRVDPVFAPRSIDKGESFSYVCNNCMGKGKSS
jgi:hypothetical protein